MKAFSLEDMAYAKGIMRKVSPRASSDPEELRQPAHRRPLRQVSPRPSTSSSRARRRRSRRRCTRAWSTNMSASRSRSRPARTTRRVRLALYFQREAPNVKSVYGLLADTALWTVVRPPSAFPTKWRRPASSFRPRPSRQRLDITDLGDPAKLEKLITRFAAAWDAGERRPPRSDPRAVRQLRPAGELRLRPARRPDFAEARRRVAACPTGSYVAISAQIAIERRIEAIANNIADVYTAGYRAAASSSRPRWNRPATRSSPASPGTGLRVRDPVPISTLATASTSPSTATAGCPARRPTAPSTPGTAACT